MRTAKEQAEFELETARRKEQIIKDNARTVAGINEAESQLGSLYTLWSLMFVVYALIGIGIVAKFGTGILFFVGVLCGFGIAAGVTYFLLMMVHEYKYDWIAWIVCLLGTSVIGYKVVNIIRG
jgi:hypothetical protein